VIFIRKYLIIGKFGEAGAMEGVAAGKSDFGLEREERRELLTGAADLERDIRN